MKQITVTFKLDDADVESGWAGNKYELEGSVIARLDELIGDDGGAYLPKDIAVSVE